ncbi:MAG: leucine-rich repeat protein [Clostridiales bacterium]|nr:leucine-rich repeat protein [Clostridiales bacterium]
MTTKARKSFSRKLIILITAALMCFVLALQFVSAPVLNVSSGAASASVGSNGVNISYSNAESGFAGEDYALSDSSVESHAATAGTPAPSDEVTVIVTVGGTPMMQFATAKNMSVAEAMATKEGKDNLEKLNAKRDLAKESVSKYIISYGFEYSTITNAFSATVKYGDVNAIRDNKYVDKVILSNTYLAPQTITENYVDVYETGIFNSSGVGYDGTGTVVAVADTGTDYTHEVFDMELDPNTLALTKDDVAAVVPMLAATSMSAARGEIIDEDDLYLKSKLPFAYDYADSDDNVYPREAHGTHVAGIIAGKSDKITGVAPGAQIATMKVFSDYTSGAKTEWILAGLNDAVTLGVDAINMSLGSSCGFSREVDEEEINKIYDSINDAGICLVVAAGNEYSSAQGSTWGNTNLATNPDSGTVGSPGSYTASLSVGSVSGVKTKYFMVDDHEIYFAESRLVGKIDSNNFVDELLGDKAEGEYEYVVVPGVGLSVNYTGIDVTGKIAVIKRGNNSFEEKIKIAMDKGAIAVVCYNNISGSVNMSIGTKPLIPSCFVSMDLAQPIVASGAGIIKVSKEFLAGPFMSDFSCWGVLPDLTLVPDITAHGGEIYSSVPGGDQYNKLSGTSMACPNLAGALILVRQYVKEHNPEYTAPETRDESYSRMMSTGTIVRNEYGNPYSPRKQGAGIADISHSINTKAYLTVDGSNKPKLSLGDDPGRTGVYTMKFNLVNASNNAVSYNMGAYVMTESMSIDERTVAEKAYMFDDTTNSYSITAKKGKVAQKGNSITVSGYGEAEITVTVKLSANDKKYLNDTFRNGMFVEGYILLDSNNLDGIDLNLPYVAFYGDWTDAPMLDVTAYAVGESNADDSVIAEEKLKPDVYGSLPFAGFASTSASEGIGYTGIGSFAYLLAEGYTAPETQEKFAALTTNPDGDYLLYGIGAGLFRGAKRIEWEIRSSATGELVKSGTSYNARKSHASGGVQSGGFVKIELDMRTLDLPNNSKYTFSMSCYLDWKDENGEYTCGNKNTFSFEFTVDNEAPVLNDVAVRKDNSGNSTRYYLDLTMYDNHYLQCYAAYTYEGIDENNYITGVTTLAKGGVIPANGEFNRDNTLTLDITQYWSQIQANGGKLYVTAYDYAKNMSSFEIVLTEETDLQITKTRTARDEYTVVPNGQIDLSDYITVRANTLDGVDENDKVYIEGYWTKDLIWESSDPTTVEVDRNSGLVTGMKEGSAIITVHTPNVDKFSEKDTAHCLSFTIKVEGEPTVIALSGIEMYMYKVDANGDLITDSNGDPIEVQSNTLSLERGEYAVVGAKTKPYNFTGDVKLEWTSTSSNVSIIDIAEDGMSAKIFAAKSGSATIRATVSGSRISGYTSVRVLNEYIVETVYLRSYTGRGGDWINEDGEVEHNVVEIPDDLGIVYIYPRAFQGNQYIKKVIIPEGVMIVMNYAFTNCPNLTEVVLPSSVETLEEYAFYQLVEWNDNSDEPTFLGHLEKINLENVKSIGRLAFHGCRMEEVDFSKCTYVDSTAFMYCTELKSIDLSRVGTVGGGAFAFCTSLKSVVIPENTTLNSFAPALIRGYLGSFYGCSGLETVEIRSKSVGDMAFAYCENLTTVTFTGDMDFIGAQAFLYCKSLTEINFNGTLYSIGDMAFFGCSALPSVTLPAGLTEIGSMAFGNDLNLTTVKISSGALLENLDATSLSYFTSVEKFIVEDGNKYLASDDYGILYDRAMKKIIAFPFGAPYSGVTLPDSVVTVGKGAFSGAWYLQSVNLNNAEYIESYAFADMIRLTSVTGTKVKYIGDYAFYATDITTLPISDSTTYIGEGAFAGCSALTTTEFAAPAKLSYLGNYAFASIDEYTHYSGDKEKRIVSFKSVKFSGDVKNLGEGVFANCTNLTTVDLGSLTSLSANMFNGCTKLATVNMPNTVKEMGEGVFAGCVALTAATLSNKLTSIPARAFADTALSAITIPQNVTYIGARAFSNTNITTIELANSSSAGDRTVRIGDYAFMGTKLTSVNSSIVSSVGKGAFSGCTGLTTVNLAAATAIGDGAFAGCSALSSVTLTAAKHIGDRAFAGCTALTAITLAGAEYVGSSAFSGATKLATVNLPKVKEMGSEVFAGTVVTTVTLPATLEKVVDGVFNGAEKLTKIEVSADNKKFITDKYGALYAVTDKDYYVLIAYPAGKTDETEYSVLDRTIRLAAYSFSGNDTLTKLTLPVYLQVIGISAMSGMSKLNEIVINATEAPTLESRSWVEYERDESGEIVTDRWGAPLYTFMNQYDNFNFVFDSSDETERSLKITVPANNSGYLTGRIWKLYVGKYIEVSDKAHATLATLNFIDRVKALPASPTAADADEIAALLRIYNMFNPVQSYIVLGRYGDYNDNGVTIDKDYYNAVLEGKNYYSILTAAQNSLPDAVASAINAELYGTAATVTTDTMRSVVIALFGLTSIVAVAVFASKINKRRGRK